VKAASGLQPAGSSEVDGFTEVDDEPIELD
jgi:hypothetical protein